MGRGIYPAGMAPTPMTPTQLDAVLEIQLAVAWAGEALTSPPRLGWWRTAMVDEFGGEDLLRRLAPRTWRWAALEAARAAAKRVDETARQAAEDPDHLVSLFRLGFEIDERLDERLLELKQGDGTPAEVFPALAALVAAPWSKDQFVAWLAQRGEVAFTTTPTGRRLRGEMPDDPSVAVAQLAAALRPLTSTYALPHFRLTR